MFKMMKYDRNHQKTNEKQWKTYLNRWFICIFEFFSKIDFRTFSEVQRVSRMIHIHPKYLFFLPPPGGPGGPPGKDFSRCFSISFMFKMMKYDRNHHKTYEKRWKTCLKWWFIWIFMVFSKFYFFDFFGWNW